MSRRLYECRTTVVSYVLAEDESEARDLAAEAIDTDSECVLPDVRAMGPDDKPVGYGLASLVWQQYGHCDEVTLAEALKRFTEAAR